MKGTLNSSVCSCTECESMSCFTTRNKVGNRCTCQNCKNSKTCLFLSNNSLNLKANKSNACSGINTKLNRTTDKMKLPQHSTCPKLHNCCGKALVGKLEKVDRADVCKKNNNEEFKSISRKGADMLHKIKFNDHYVVSRFDTQSVVGVEDDVHMDHLGHMAAILKPDHREQETDVCVKDNVSLFAMENSQCASPCTFETNSPTQPFKMILQPKSKEARCETLNESNISDKILDVSDSKSDATKITDQIRLRVEAYEANKMNKLKSKFGTSKFVRGNAEVTKEQVQKEIVYESESDTNMEIKDSTSIHQDDNNPVQPPVNTVRSATVSFSHSVTNKASAARLSAQIMNVPFMEFQKSLSFDFSAENINKPKISKYDIIQRIKDVYKTCSCKVCECIASVGLSPWTEKEDCKCKPCDCDECRKYLSPKRHPASYKLLADHFHDCDNLDNKKQVLPKVLSNSDACKSRSELCDCKPCDCLDCLKYNYLQHVCCDCEPCECIECKRIRIKKTRTLIVAPVGEDSHHRQYCQCSPCACGECGFSYGPVSPNLTQDTGTSAYYRHVSCNCDSCINEACTQNGDMCICERRNKLMRKPVRSDKNDYDIHNVTVKNSNNIGKYRQNNTRNNETVAMLSSYSYAPKVDTGYYNYNTNHEKDNNNATNFKDLHISNMINDCYDKESNRDVHVNWNKNKTEQYLSCSNRHCSRDVCVNNTHLSLDCCDYVESKSYDDPCKETFLSKINTSKDARVIMQEDKSRNNEFNSDRYSHQLLVNKNNSSTLFAAKPWYLCKKSSTIENCEQNYKVFCMIPQQLDTSILRAKEKHAHINMENMNKPTKTSYNVSKACTELTKCKETDSDSSGSYTSARSSSAYPDLLSSVNNSSMTTQVNRQANKSSDSCNSSGHDNSEYLIQFPRCAIEACIKDVLNLGTHVNVTSVKCGSSIEEYSTPKISEKLKKEDNNACGRGIKPGQIYNAADGLNYFSNPKSQRNVCSYTTCFCSELCLSKDSCLHNKKNEETQLFIQGNDQDVRTVNHTNSTANLRSLTEDIASRPLKRSFADVQDLCNFQVTTTAKTKNEILDKLYDNNGSLITPIIYDSVENTIKEAQQFSKQLLELLHKYEKANSEFESVSEKLKIAQNASINRNLDFNAIDANAQRYEEPEKDQIVRNKKEHVNASVNDHMETPIKINNVYTTYYTASIQKDERLIKVFDGSNDELLINHNTENFLPNDKCFYEIKAEPDSDVNPEVVLTNACNTYKAYRKLIKRAARVKRRFNTRNIVTSNSPSKASSRFESKTINTKSQPKREMEKETSSRSNGHIRQSSFGNVEIQSTETPDEDNVEQKIGNINFKEDFESQYIEEKSSSDEVLRSPYNAKNNSSSIKLHEASIETQVSDPIIVQKWNNFKHSVLLNFQKEVDSLLQMSLLSSQSLYLAVKDLKNSIQLESNLTWNVEDEEVCTSVVKEKNGRIPVMKNNDQSTPILERSIPAAEEKDRQTVAKETDPSALVADEKYHSTPVLQEKDSHMQVVEYKGCKAPVVINKDQCIQIIDEYGCSTRVVQRHRTEPSAPGEKDGLPPFVNQIQEDQDYQKPLVQDEDLQTPMMHAVMSSSLEDWELMNDSKKVTFPKISKVSNHTIVVKWHIPKSIDGVEGYELLADGRAMDKILSPTSNMAVLTCLPRTDKIQVTIKTLISKLRPGYQLPSVTTVYCPRSK